MVDKKKILIIGCSNGLGLHHVFRDVFKKEKSLNFITEQSAIGTSGLDEYDEIMSDDKCIFYNLSYGGAGNTYIGNRCIEFVLDNKVDYVYLQFSGLNRIDLPLTNDELHIDAGIRTRISKNHKWIASGGYTGSWLRHPFSERLFSYFYSKESAYPSFFLNLLEIFKCISFLRDKNIDFNWSSYYDYVSPPSINCHSDGMIRENDSLYSLYDKLDKNKFIMPPLNYILTNNLKTEQDQIHYPYESTLKWITNFKNKFNFPDIG